VGKFWEWRGNGADLAVESLSGGLDGAGQESEGGEEISTQTPLLYVLQKYTVYKKFGTKKP
jgi:hypothetical protein